MRILIAHNAYQQYGGEDGVVKAEIDLLRNAGNEVFEYFRHNDEIKQLGSLQLVQDTLWSRKTTQDLEALLAQHQPDVIHTHNTFPLISPSIYWTAKRAGVPIVQTLHNFRLLCPQAMLLRDGVVCEDCVGKIPWRGVVNKCYRDSMVQSAVLASQITLHQCVGTYRNTITRYIALSEFSRDKFIEGGLPPEKIRLKPNFINLPDKPNWQSRLGGVFVGRLSKEKGLDVLVEAVNSLKNSSVTVIGGGDMDDLARVTFGSNYLGFQSLEMILSWMRKSLYLVLPSICYEQFPRTIVEAFACGIPVITSRIGPQSNIVEDNQTGLLFEAGDSEDLAAKLAWADSHPNEMIQMGKNARVEYDSKYTSELNYKMLMDIYEDAIAAIKKT